MRRTIGTYPDPSLTGLLYPAGPFAEALGGLESLHPSGRSALYWAFMGLRLPKVSTVWMPSYHCGVEVQAALDAGASVRFYPISDDLTFDPAQVVAKVKERIGPILVIHYFGFRQPGIDALARLCRAEGWVLVEDCAHSLFS